ncbi:AEC family transporter [Ciceribacter sp. L1K23]|uniref:AEC family transporter n=1 Tax=Ciceribacter sp. L1K23 TaxID=2820276 RepID=UPI001B826004|nr:AEC family transporter [Ciceribacter sp. L1K23]MBR0555982.1 AEC family transporter [Ciceribacter sp. L1K23]
MLPIFESILPVFLLVLLGTGLKRVKAIDAGFWHGLDQFGYFVLFPALLFQTLSNADFAGLSTATVALTTNVAVLVMSLLVLSLWPLAKSFGLGGPAFTTLFQTSTRWNAFIGLAIAEKLAGTIGITIVAVTMAAIIVPINFYNVGVLVWFGNGRRDIRSFVTRIVTNPIILGAAAGVAFNLSGITLYEPLAMAVDLVARASLGLGLIMVGAGLRIADALRPRKVVLLAGFLKLLFFPMVMVATAMAFGLSGEVLVMLALGAGVPTAMNGYVLAKQMGGDAPLYATIATLQTAAAFLTIPLVIVVARYVAGG